MVEKLLYRWIFVMARHLGVIEKSRAVSDLQTLKIPNFECLTVYIRCMNILNNCEFDRVFDRFYAMERHFRQI